MKIKQGIVIPCLGYRRQLAGPIKTNGERQMRCYGNRPFASKDSWSIWTVMHVAMVFKGRSYVQKHATFKKGKERNKEKEFLGLAQDIQQNKIRRLETIKI